MANTEIRGVYRARTLTLEGRPYLKAVTAGNRVVARVTMYPWDSEEELVSSLYRVLDRVDPAGGVYGQA